MLQRLSDGVNGRLAFLFPERRVILRSETRTSYHRVSPLMQASAAALIVGLLGWTGFASLKLAETSLRASTATERLRAESGRLTDLAEAHDAALSLYAAAENRIAALEASLASKSREASSRADMLAALNDKLGDVASARDNAAETTQSLTLQIDELSAEISERAARQERIFARLESAAAASLDSLEDVFDRTGAALDPILDEVRRDQDGAGGPFLPADDYEALSGDEEDAARLSALMSTLERVNLLRAAAEQMPFGRPAASTRRSSGFGMRNDPKNGRRARHEGLDLAGRRGSAVTATGPGVVTYAGWRRGYGKIVEIEHAFGYETRYAHLSRTRVKVGALVERGDRIGDMGSTGRSTGPHLHYEVRIGGAPVNPVKYIEAARHVL
ncbi:MAG: DUF5930 domain-containing protein [Pikeienuella sp.]